MYSFPNLAGEELFQSCSTLNFRLASAPHQSGVSLAMWSEAGLGLNVWHRLDFILRADGSQSLSQSQHYQLAGRLETSSMLLAELCPLANLEIGKLERTLEIIWDRSFHLVVREADQRRWMASLRPQNPWCRTGDWPRLFWSWFLGWLTAPLLLESAWPMRFAESWLSTTAGPGWGWGTLREQLP